MQTLVGSMPQVALMPSTQSGGLEFLEQLGFATTASVTAQALKQQARYKVTLGLCLDTPGCQLQYHQLKLALACT